jgi:hypothetical protein
MWHALPLPPLLSSHHAPPSLSHHRFVIRARNHLSPLLLTSGVFSCLPAHSRLVPHTHRPFAWPEHPSNRVIACTLSLSSVPAKLDRLSLQARPWPPLLEHTSGVDIAFDRRPILVKPFVQLIPLLPLAHPFSRSSDKSVVAIFWQ